MRTITKFTGEHLFIFFAVFGPLAYVVHEKVINRPSKYKEAEKKVEKDTTYEPIVENTLVVATVPGNSISEEKPLVKKEVKPKKKVAVKTITVATLTGINLNTDTVVKNTDTTKRIFKIGVRPAK